MHKKIISLIAALTIALSGSFAIFAEANNNEFKQISSYSLKSGEGTVTIFQNANGSILRKTDTRSYHISDLQLNLQRQKKTNWCWAACSTAVADWYGVNTTQERVVKYLSSTLENVKAKQDQICAILNKISQNQFKATNLPHISDLTNQLVYDSIEAGNPMIFIIEDDYSSARAIEPHAVICVGYRSTVADDPSTITHLFIMDPSSEYPETLLLEYSSSKEKILYYPTGLGRRKISQVITFK